MKTFCVIVLVLFTTCKSFSQSLNNDTATIICVFDDPPQFPGGQEALEKFLSKNLRVPKKQAKIAGRVILSFTVQADGRLKDFVVRKKLLPEYDEEALRVMKKSPRWKPSMQNGKPVKSGYALPILFN
jgi:protein TonB